MANRNTTYMQRLNLGHSWSLLELIEMDSENVVTQEKALFDSVSKVVCNTVKKTGEEWEDSFILHAPLELCARYFLLPLVKDDYRSGALKQIENIQHRFEKYEKVNDDRKRVVLTPDTDFSKWASSSLFAGHATVLVALAKRIGETNEYIIDLLETMNITGGPTLHFGQIADNEIPIDRSNIASWFYSNVANIKKVQCSDDSITSIVNSTGEAGLISPLASSWNESDVDPFDMLHHVFPILLRIATISMILEDEKESQYGWTHCLTIPHSHWVLADNPTIQKELFNSALAYVSSFRSVIGKVAINASDFVSYFDEDEEAVFTNHYEEMTEIISRACTLEDAHLVKYVYSCFDIMKRDPHYAKLYIAAAKTLLDQWT